MIKLHALEFSRATRVLWLLEDLGQNCERIDYERTPEFRAPEELTNVHPLGKSPIIEDQGEMIAESSTILRYLSDKFGDQSHRPPVGTPDYWVHEALFDFVESSFAEVAMGVILPAFEGNEIPNDAKRSLDKHLGYVEDQIGGGPLLFGDTLTLADIQMSYPIALLSKLGRLDRHPKMEEYWSQLQKQPGYIAAVKKAGPMAPDLDQLGDTK